MKNQCASCLKDLENSEELYAQFGNYCDVCSAKCSTKAKARGYKEIYRKEQRDNYEPSFITINDFLKLRDLFRGGVGF